MKLVRKIKNKIKIVNRKYAFWLVNKKCVGTRCFDRKLKALRRGGYKIGDNTKIVGPVFITADLEIGANCWIGKDFEAQGNGKIIIGDNCDIAPNVIINTGGHQIGDNTRRAGEGRITNITVGEGTWIGVRTTILNDTNIGKGNVIAAGSVVIKSSNDNVLLAGVPAKEKKKLD